MTKTQFQGVIDALEKVRDDNRFSAREAALSFVKTNDGTKQRTALVDDATAEAYQNALDVIDSIENP